LILLPRTPPPRPTLFPYTTLFRSRNLLWGIKECGLEHSTHLIETTTTGVYGSPNFTIPEGFIHVETDSGSDTIPYPGMATSWYRSEEHTSELQSRENLVCRLLLEK